MRLNGKSITPIWLTAAAMCCSLAATAPNAQAYCPANAYGDDEYIESVNVGTISSFTAACPVDGYTDNTALSTDMEIAQSYPITIVNGVPDYDLDQCAVWIDWNHDDDFADLGEAITLTNANGPGPYTGTILVPNGATLGNTRMRVRIAWDETPQPCGDAVEDYGSTEDFTLNILPPTSPTNPSVSLALSQPTGLIGAVFTATATVAPGANPASTDLAVSLNATQIDGGTLTMYDDGTHGDAAIGDNVFTNNAVTVGPGAVNGNYTLTATVTDAQARSGNGIAAFGVGYCATASTSTNYEYISRVVIGTIDNTPGGTGRDHYTDYTSSVAPTTLLQNVGAPIDIFNGYTTTYTTDICHVFVDWNHDGDFTDGDESYLCPQAPNPPGVNKWHGVITAPPSALLGLTTMRVKMVDEDSNANGSSNPCGTFTYGEVEDYAVNVEVPPPEGACCTGNDCNIVPTGTCAGTYYGDGSICDANRCVAACCHDNTCENLNAADCVAVSGVWHQFEACAPGGSYYCPPANDNCADVTPVALTADVVQTYTGDNRGATADCEGFEGPNAWIAFTLDGTCPTWHVKLDYCGTTPAFENAWLNAAFDCGCATASPAGDFNVTECIDGNVTIRWILAPGTYYYPVLSSQADNAFGPYTINVLATRGYCEATADTDDEFISGVEVGTISHSTAVWPDNGYQDLTAISTDAVSSQSYPITVTNGPPNYADDVCGVWVDWDRSYTFDAGEFVTMTGSPGTGPYTGSIDVPPAMTPGPVTMRVRIMYDIALVPCSATDYGSTEDYTINVVSSAETIVDCSAGDMDRNGPVNGLDIHKFVNVLVGADTNPQSICDADVDGDGATNLADVGPMIGRALGTAVPYYTVTAPAAPACDGTGVSITVSPAVDASHLLFVRNGGTAGECDVKAQAYDVSNAPIGSVLTIKPKGAKSLPVGTVRVDYNCPTHAGGCTSVVGP